MYSQRTLTWVGRCTANSLFERVNFLHEEINALLALSLIQVLCESIDVSVSEFFAWLQVGRAFQDGNHFFWQFVAWVLGAHVILPLG